jgi:hypothetical protein
MTPGRVTFTFIKRDRVLLPIHQMKAGDEAEVYDALQLSKANKGDGRRSSSVKKSDNSSSDTQHICGVVSKVTPTSIEFVCDDAQGDEGSSSWLLSSSSLRLDMRSSEATHKKLTVSLECMRSVAGESECSVSAVYVRMICFMWLRDDTLSNHVHDDI